MAVRLRLDEEHSHDPDTRIVEEMGIWNGAVRVDLAVINGEIAGYELKSERDTLDRLPKQALLYNQVFDRVHLVAAGKHVEKAIPFLPRWWGVWIARSDRGVVTLEVARAGMANPDVQAIQLARLLWRDEALALAERHHCAKGVRSAAREKIAARLAETLPSDELATAVRRLLKDRVEWLRKPVGDYRKVPIGGDFGPLGTA